MRDIGQNINKLVSEMKMAQSPEAMVYLRLLGNEMGYLTTTDMEGVADTAARMIASIVKMFQTDVITFFLHTLIHNIYKEMTYLTPLWVFLPVTAD